MNSSWPLPPEHEIRVECNDASGRFTVNHAKTGAFDGEKLELFFELQELPIVNPGTEFILAALNENEDEEVIYFKTKVVDVWFGRGLIVVAKPQRIDIKELRQFFRCPINVPVKLVVGERTIEGQGKNISAGGMLVEVENQVKLICGLRLTCEFTLPGLGIPLGIRGEIVRLDKAGNGRCAVAIRFTAIHEKTQQDIIQYQFKWQREMALKRKNGKKKI
ncbi:MAG TPA: PilZ domain-containing protein [Bacillota bacterium]|nr:PilZ domain-containing protein [Bacillota bacterium]HPT68221.1 PilZ domain-containing protein [Bacillota bacterium]